MPDMTRSPANGDFDDRHECPPLVARANALCKKVGFPLTRQEAGPDRPSACMPGVGRFLAVLAAGCHGGRIGELGTGAGVGSAWLASAMPADCTLVTAEINESLAATARGVLADDPRVEVITGDAATVLADRGPYCLLFADSGLRSPEQFSALVSLLRLGGRIIMDDLVPLGAPQRGSPAADDLKRRFFASESRLTWTEVVLPDLGNSLLVGTKRI
jgi:predicted O-methyltransferase YrrM